MLEDSVKKRFVFKFVISVFSAALNFGLMLFFPKFLGPLKYGQYEFAVNNFTILSGALTFSVPDAFFNWISRKAKTLRIGEITATTFIFLFLVFLSVLIFIFLVNFIGVFNSIWPGISVGVAILGLLIAFSTQFFNVCSILADGLGLTATFEFFRLLQNVLKFLLIGGLCFLGYSSLNGSLLAFFSAITLSITASLIWFGKKNILKFSDFKSTDWDKENLKTFTTFTYKYIKPLVIYSGIGFAFSFFDIWFLQFVGGSVEQSYLGISMRLAGIAGLINLAILPILAREFAVAHETQNENRMQILFERIHLFYFISFFFGTILFFNAEKILLFVGGKDYALAIIVFKILAFYPALQTLGRLHGAVYYSTARTKLYSSVGVLLMPLGIALSYYLIGRADSIIPGLHLGAKGIAYKMIIIDTISVFTLLLFNSQFLKISFLKQLFSILLISIFQIVLYLGIDFLYNRIIRDLYVMQKLLNFNSLNEIIIKSLIFLCISGCSVFLFPILIGFNRKDLMSHMKIGRKI